MSKKRPDFACVIRVGEGRGFIIEQRTKVIPYKNLKLRPFRERRLVVTAAHCLPKLPVAHAAGLSDRVYRNLMGTLNERKPTVWAECLFVDPIADVAVLGSPDHQTFFNEADAYDTLTESTPVLRIANAKGGRGLVLALDGRRWLPTRMEMFSGPWGTSLIIDPTEGGMSGSPILNDRGRAVGVVVIGTETVSNIGVKTNERAGPQAILARDLPAWLLS